MTEFVCAKCGLRLSTKATLIKHEASGGCELKRFQCSSCKIKFNRKKDLNWHANHGKCRGIQQTHEQKDKEIMNLKNALAAASGLNSNIEERHHQSRLQIIENQTNTHNINVEQIQNVTQHIVILNCGEENIDHFRQMPLQQLKDKIGFDKNPSTHIEAYKLIHLDPQHPENHNLLLTDRDSDQVHFFGNDNWNSGSFDEQMRIAIFDVNRAIQRTIPEQHRDEYYWNHLEYGIGAKCNSRDDAALRPIFEGLRDPLHQSTLRLMGMPINQRRNKSEPIGDSARDIILNVEKERTKQIELREKTRMKELELSQEKEREKTRQMELQLELARLQKQSEN